MKSTQIKAKWATKLLRAKNFVVITDTESVVFSEHTNPNKFEDYVTASAQLSALRKFQFALNKATRKFEKGLSERFDAPPVKRPLGRKIKVKHVK